MPMASIKTRGIILQRRVYGEADRILTILTPGMGKMTAIANGARRLTSKMGGHLELFYVVDWVLAEGRNWHVVTSADVVDSFQELRLSLTTVEQASYLAQLVSRLSPDDQVQPKMYHLLVEAFGQLSGSRGTTLLRQVEWQLLLASGLQPELRACSHCTKALDPITLGLCPERGGALCPDCMQVETVHVPIQAETLKVLRLFERAPLQLSTRLQLSSAVQEELARTTKLFLEHALEQSIKFPTFGTLQPSTVLVSQ